MKKIKDRILFKSLFGLVFLLVFFAAVVVTIGYKTFTDSLLEQYEEGAYRIAETALNYVDAEKIEDYANSGGTTEEYLEVLHNLDVICNSTDATFVYLIRPDVTDYNHITFLFSTVNRKYDYEMYSFGYLRETTNDDYRNVYRNMYESGLDRAIVVRDKGYIETDSHITALIPVKDSNGSTKAILCVQRQMEELTLVRQNYLKRVFIAFLAILLFVILGQAVYLNRVLLDPLKRITKEASRFAKENTIGNTRLKNEIKNKDEIGMLAESVDHMEVQIQSHIKKIKSITAEKERINTELSLATKIQLGMLPNIFPPYPDRKEFDLYASMTPAKEVGGDFYDFFLKDDNHLCMVMADVSGKGIPAALYMMASKIIIANNALIEDSPSKILERTNRMICSNNKEGFFVTVWLGIMEISSGKIVAANAGHEYPLVCSDGKFNLLKDKHGFVIGGMDGMTYTDYEIHLNKGDKLFIYTDGVTEATNEEGELYGQERLNECINLYTGLSPKEIVEAVGNEIGKFTGEAEQFDDITMLCAEYRG